jgi:hypothetical protein
VLAGLIVLAVAAANVGIHTAKDENPRGADMVALQAKNLSASGQAVAMPSFADLVDNVRQAVVSVRGDGRTRTRCDSGRRQPQSVRGHAV